MSISETTKEISNTPCLDLLKMWNAAPEKPLPMLEALIKGEVVVTQQQFTNNQ